MTARMLQGGAYERPPYAISLTILTVLPVSRSNDCAKLQVLRRRYCSSVRRKVISRFSLFLVFLFQPGDKPLLSFGGDADAFIRYPAR
ncbi:MAG: hypothetical protein H6573_19005 [Lewinellaceae bacterium]|nr:hypothetical protein [Lewinellaceae bacterium]